MQSLHVCPVCGTADPKQVLVVEDHTVSREQFQIAECANCTLRFTLNVPPQQEIGRYYQSEQYISHTDSKVGIFNRIYQLVRNYSLGSKRKMVSGAANKQKGVVLDYGCGTGSFLHEMKSNGWDVSGVEPDSNAAEKAKMLTGVDILSPDRISAMADSKFDIITLWHVLEHVHELKPTLTELKRILKKDGKIFVAVPNYECFDARYYKEYWAAYDVPRHLYHFSRRSMYELMDSTGFQIETVLPMWFDSFYVSLLSERYKKNPIGPLIAFVVGVLSNFSALWNGKTSSLIYVIRPA